jgi:hypothetical protein
MLKSILCTSNQLVLQRMIMGNFIFAKLAILSE